MQSDMTSEFMSGYKIKFSFHLQNCVYVILQSIVTNVLFEKVYTYKEGRKKRIVKAKDLILNVN